MEKLSTLAWYECSVCHEIKHGENFYKLPNGACTAECCECYDAAQPVTEENPGEEDIWVPNQWD